MSAAANELQERRRKEEEERRRLSKVSFSSISSDVLCVKIRSVSREEDTSAMSGVFQTVRENTAAENENANDSKSTMTDSQKTTSISSQTVERERKVATISSQTEGGQRNVPTVSSQPVERERRVPTVSLSLVERERRDPTISSQPVERDLRVPTVSPQKKKRERRVPTVSSQSVERERKVPTTSSQPVEREQKAPITEIHDNHGSAPCLRHAAENISRKASDIPSEKINLCNNCSKSMLSYIFVVQDFLDSLAKEISGGETSSCLQCARQELRRSLTDSALKDAASPSNAEQAFRTHPDHNIRTDSKHDRSSGKRISRAKSHRQDSWRNEDAQKGFESAPPPPHRHANQEHREFNYNETPSPKDVNAQNAFNTNRDASSSENQTGQQQSAPPSGFEQHRAAASDQGNYHQSSASGSQNNQQWTQNSNLSNNQLAGGNNEAGHRAPPNESSSNRDYVAPRNDGGGKYVQHPENEQFADKRIFRTPAERYQPNYDGLASAPQDGSSSTSENATAQSPTLYRDDVDGIISTLSNAEREVYDSARNNAGWESLGEPQERLGLPSGHVISSEAFVTSCRNNAEAIGCLVVGTSLLLCRTSRTLCVLVSDGVSTAFRNALTSVFQVVQYVRSLDSLGTTKLALLEQPELGISFEKLNVWRLAQFNKCIYLNPDTLVIQNCDELFCREELSAVPDIGWPDCFNSGMFVYSPSVGTFWQLLEFAEKQGSYDGGDQGLLNSYFNSWSSDMSKKLSFIYNLMANVSYTYAPAFKQFGRDVKIVQFHGSFKPWHVKFFTKTGQISPSSPVHPTYVQFVHIWINIFRISVLRLLSQEIQSYAASQETICAVETLRFFPLPTESESEFFLTPPSVRLRLAEKKLSRSTSLPISEARRRKSAEFFRYKGTEDEIPESSASDGKKAEETLPSATVEEPKTSDETPGKSETRVSEAGEVFEELKVAEKEKAKDEDSLPGAEVGDYQGMKAWEQGRMDYQGTDSSDNVIKRLEFLMSGRPN